MQQTTHFKPISSPQLLHLHWIMKLLWSKKNSWRKIIWPRNMYIINPGSAIVGETIPLYFCGLHEVTVSIHPALAYFLLQVTHFLARWTLITFLQPPPSSSSDGRSSTPSSSSNHSPVSRGQHRVTYQDRVYVQASVHRWEVHQVLGSRHLKEYRRSAWNVENTYR